MGLGSALARGISGVASGVSRASQSWPEERARQAQLKQQQTEFKAQEIHKGLLLTEKQHQFDAIRDQETERLRTSDLRSQMDQWMGLLPDAMQSDAASGTNEGVALIQENLAKLQSEIENRPPAYSRGTTLTEGGPLGVAPAEGFTPTLSEAVVRKPVIPDEVGPKNVSEPGAMGPEAMDLSSLKKGKQSKLFAGALDTVADEFEDSGDMDNAIKFAKAEYPGMTADEEKRIREIASGSISDLAPETVEAYARIAAKNPSAILLQSLTRSEKSEVVKSMLDQGLVPTEGIPPTVVARLTDFDTALFELAALGGLAEDSPELFGPIAGNTLPYMLFTDIRVDSRKLISRIDDVRQLVGKAKEGGVLRKEDEEKYKRILATITDEPEVALYKIHAVLRGLKYQRDRYIYYTKMAGMHVDISTVPVIWPVDVEKAGFKELLFFAAQWPELDPIIAKRFPEKYENFVAPTLITNVDD